LNGHEAVKILHLFDVEDSVVHVGDARRSGGRDDVPEVEGLTVGVRDGHVHHFAHVVLEEQAPVLVVVDEVFWKRGQYKFNILHLASF
jgi:hypothetical protein